MFRVVLDTNILIDGSRDDYSYGNRIIEEVLNNNLQAFSNYATLKENRTLSVKKITDEPYLKKLQVFFDQVKCVDRRLGKLNIVEDPEDNKLVEAARDANADFLISSDNHLLKLGSFEKTQIVTPAQFWSIYEETSGQGWKAWLTDFIKP